MGEVFAAEGANLDGPAAAGGGVRGGAAHRHRLGGLRGGDQMKARMRLCRRHEEGNLLLRRGSRGRRCGKRLRRRSRHRHLLDPDRDGSRGRRGRRSHLSHLHRLWCARRFRQLGNLYRTGSGGGNAALPGGDGAAGVGAVGDAGDIDRRGAVAAIAGAGRDIGRQIVHGVLLGRGRPVGAGGGQTRADRGNVFARFVRQRAVVAQIVVQPVGAGVVGGQEAGRAVDVVHLAQIGGAGHDVFMRIERVRPKVVAFPQLVIRAGHHLHQAHGAGVGGDQAAIAIQRATGFLAHNRPDPAVRHIEALGRFPDVGAPGIARRARRTVVATGAGGIIGCFLGRAYLRTAGACREQSQNRNATEGAEPCGLWEAGFTGDNEFASGRAGNQRHPQIASVVARPKDWPRGKLERRRPGGPPLR